MLDGTKFIQTLRNLTLTMPVELFRIMTWACFKIFSLYASDQEQGGKPPKICRPALFFDAVFVLPAYLPKSRIYEIINT